MTKHNKFPDADFKPLGRQSESRMTSHDIVCLHTMVGGLAGTDAFFREDGFGGVEAHFGVGPRGEVIQWQSLEFSADANLDGNHRIISIETADSGNPFPRWSGSDVPKWTPDQLDALVSLVGWLCRNFDIPAELIPDSKPGRRGIGYHRQGIEGNFKDGLVPGGERWSTATGKVCPGDRRIRQLKDELIPQMASAHGAGTAASAAEPVVDLDRIVRAASAAVLPGVRTIEKALVAERLLDESRMDGVWGPKTTAAYAQCQTKCGLTGTDADGIPGAASLRKLGDKHGFAVRDRQR